MIGPAPEWMQSEWYDPKNTCIKKGAPEDIKKTYEEYFNSESMERCLKEDYDFEHPYISWTGEVIEKPTK